MNKKKLEDYFLSEMENIRHTVSILENFLGTVSDPPQTTQLAAISVFLHNIYGGFENFLKRLARFHGLPMDKTDRWHQNLLAVSQEQRWIDEELNKRLTAMLSFRHAFVHSYVFNIPWDQLRPLAYSAAETASLFEKQMVSLLPR